ncbi:MAG: hypothetical protein AABX17_03825 [Nanoarchaeota archaeon]
MEYAEDKDKIDVKTKLKNFWKWLWNSDSWLSYIVFLAIVFVFIKFIFLPGLGLIFGTSLPLAIVESSSMDHHSLQDMTSVISICGKTFSDSKSFNAEEYWQTCGSWYEQNTNITQEQFSSFSFKNGFRKGDIMIIVKKKTIKIGDVLIFEAGSAHPIIHRVISLNPIQTKGDHNEAQLIPGNNNYGADERNIQESKVLGTAVFKIPWLGWPKLFIVELWNKIVK